MLQTITPGKYSHYKKNDLYEVIGFALHTETREKIVLYKALYETPELIDEFGPEPIFARPYKMFAAYIEKDGQKIPRFKRVT